MGRMYPSLKLQVNVPFATLRFFQHIDSATEKGIGGKLPPGLQGTRDLIIPIASRPGGLIK